jgi:hypothetical protein
MVWLYVPELVESNSDSKLPSEIDYEPFVTLNGHQGSESLESPCVGGDRSRGGVVCGSGQRSVCGDH